MKHRSIEAPATRVSGAGVMSTPGVTAGKATLEAARTMFRMVGYDEQAIERALLVLDGREETPKNNIELLTPQDVCKWLGISLSTLWRWRIPHVKVCGTRRFYRDDVEKFLNSRYVRRPELD